jgi:hypothetical protein
MALMDVINGRHYLMALMDVIKMDGINGRHYLMALMDGIKGRLYLS